MAVVTIGAEKGGVGKSSLSLNIAALAAADGAEVLLLDTDVQGSVSTWTRIRAESQVEPEIVSMALKDNAVRTLTALSGKYDLIVVDIGAQNYATMTQAVLVSDLVLVPCGPDQFEFESALHVFETFRSLLDAQRPGGPVPAWMVLNKLSTNPRSAEEGALREALAESEIPVFDAALRYRASWRTAGRTGRALHELRGRDADARAAAEMRAVYEELVARLSPPRKSRSRRT